MEDKKIINKRQMLAEPYPRNMLLTLVDGAIEIPEITDDIRAGVEYVLLSALKEREREVLRQRYMERKTYTAIAESLGVSKSRIPQNEYHAFRTMRYKRNLGFLLYGKEGFAARNFVFTLPDEPIPEPTDPEPAVYIMPFEELDLSVRSFNSLRRAGYEFVGDIIELSSEDILKIKYVSRKNLEEIARKLYDLGFRNIAWDEYLYSKKQ